MPRIEFVMLLFMICCSFAYFADGYRIKRFNFLMLIPLFLLIFIFGVRVNYGVDDASYLEYYVHKNSTVEPLYRLISHLFFYFHSPYQFFFAAVAVLGLGILYKGINLFKISYFWFFYIFFLYYFAFYIGILRQSIAVSIIFCSLYYFLRKNYRIWALLILIASGFHKSSFIMLALCPLANIARRPLRYAYYCVPLLFVIVFYNRLWDWSLKILTLFIFNERLKMIINAFLTWQLEINSGLGVRLRILAYICVLPKFIEIAKQDKQSLFLFNLFYIGLLGKFIFGQNMNFARLFVGAYMTEFYLFPKAMQSINKKNVYTASSSFCIFGLLILTLLFLKENMNGFYHWDLDFTWKTNFITV